MKTKKCPECGYQNPENAKFCKKCGEKFVEKSVICPKCHEKNKPGSRFCEECGYDLEKKEEKANDGKGIICPKCHTNNKEGSKFCEECGYDLETTEEPVDEPEESEEEKEEEEEVEEGKCPECGYQNKANAKFCKKCGAKIITEAKEDEAPEEQNDDLEEEREKETSEEELSVTCPKCHTKNKEGSRFCEECGYDLETAEEEDDEPEESEEEKEEEPVEEPKENEEEPKEEEEKEEEEEVKEGKCPECGYQNTDTAKFCKKCGTKLLVEDQEKNQEEVEEESDDEEDLEEETIAEQEDEIEESVEEPVDETGEESADEPEEIKEEKEEEKIEKSEVKVKEIDEDSEDNDEEKPKKSPKKKAPVKKKKAKKKVIVILIIIIILIAAAVFALFHFNILNKENTKKETTTTEKKEVTKDGWSSWTTKLPKNITEKKYNIEEKTQYAKRTKETKTSTSKKLKGWTLYDTKESGKEKTEEVETLKKTQEFENNKDIKIIKKETITEKYTAVLCGYYNPKEGQNRFYSPSEKEPYCDEKESYTLEENKGEYDAGTYKLGDNFDKSYTNSNGEKIYYKVVKVDPYKVKYTYKDSDDKTTYYFYKWTSWSKYQDKKIEEDENTEVKTRTVYRYKEKENN